MIEDFNKGKFSALPKELEDIRREALAEGKTEAEANAAVQAEKVRMEEATARLHEDLGKAA